MEPSRSRWRAPRETIQRARELRQPLTPTEVTLWDHLRGGALGGYRFRRQHPIGPFIADFFCPERKLVVEVDGPIHDTSTKEDEERSQWLREYKGCNIIRFTNAEIERDVAAVLQRILDTLSRPPL